MAGMLPMSVTAEAEHWMLSAGVAIYNTFLRSVALKKVFFWSALVLIGVHLMQLGLVTGGRGYMNQLASPVLCRCLQSPPVTFQSYLRPAMLREFSMQGNC